LIAKIVSQKIRVLPIIQLDEWKELKIYTIVHEKTISEILYKQANDLLKKFNYTAYNFKKQQPIDMELKPLQFSHVPELFII